MVFSMIWILPTIFVLVNGPTGEHVRTYEGQSPETVLSLLASEGKTGSILTQRQYNDYLVAHPRFPPAPDTVREQARLDLNNKAKTTVERLEAMIKYLDLD